MSNLNEVRVLSPCGGLGYGFPPDSLEQGLRRNPHVIGVDAGSTDPGPYYLGAGKTILGWDAQKRDLEHLLAARHLLGIPMLIGTAGGSGAQPHLTRTIEIIKQIGREKGFTFKLAAITADIDKQRLKYDLKAGRVRPFEMKKELTAATIDNSTHIVAQMGMEPYLEALAHGADVIVAGRSYDPAVIAAVPVQNGFDCGLAIHMGKILECGAAAAEPGGIADCMLGTLRKDHFVLEPLNPQRRCTTASVAAHSLYEKDNPVHLLLPGGALDLSAARFEAMDDRRVKVSGSAFLAADTYTIKLEGAERVGFRSIFIAGVRDPLLISQIDTIIEFVQKAVAQAMPYTPGQDYQLLFRLYGKNGVMGAWEPEQGGCGHELGIVGEAVGATRRIAAAVCSFARGAMLHYHYPGRKATAGNLAFPYSPSDIDMGEVYNFSIYHLLEVEDPLEPFAITYEQV